jgi:hypothetical protein
MKPFLITLFALCATLQAEDWTGTSDVRFKATSTLHDFEGRVGGVPLKVTATGSRGRRMISATSDVEVTRLTTDEKDRDENMWKMFNAAAFKFIKIAVPETPESAMRPARGKPGHMPINLTIAGTSGTVAGRVENLRESAGAAAFDLSFAVSLKAFGLKPPSTLGGLIRVGDAVAVTVHVTLAREKS